MVKTRASREWTPRKSLRTDTSMTDTAFLSKVVAIIDAAGEPISDPHLVDAYDKDVLEVIVSGGHDAGLSDDMRFIVYELGEELFDPVSKASLGHFEIVKGRGRIVHMQGKMSTLRTARIRKVLNNPFAVRNALTNEISKENYKSVPIPFKNIKIGDLVRPI